MIRQPFLVSLSVALLGSGLAFAQPAVSPLTAPKLDASNDKTTTVPAPAASADSVLPANCGTSCNDCPRLTVEAEYLLWWLKAAPTPPLLTTSSDPADRGILGNPSTTTLFGGGDTNYGAFSGFRLLADYRINDVWSLQAGGFLLDEQSQNRVFSSSGGPPTIAIPFVDAGLGIEDANRLAAPSSLSGSAAVHLDARLWGLEANSVALLLNRGNWRIDAVIGLRYENLSERLELGTTSTNISPNPSIFAGTIVAPGTTFTGFDQFGTRNAFYGAQAGLEAEWHSDFLSVSAYAKLGMGVTQERSSVKGGTSFLSPDGTTGSAIGETLALSSNVGTFTDELFTVLPEVGINVGVQLTSRVSLYGGYQFTYWSDVVRPGDQIDRNVNANLIPVESTGSNLGSQSPTAGLRHTDFWAQGLNAGLKFAW